VGERALDQGQRFDRAGRGDAFARRHQVWFGASVEGGALRGVERDAVAVRPVAVHGSDGDGGGRVARIGDCRQLPVDVTGRALQSSARARVAGADDRYHTGAGQQVQFPTQRALPCRVLGRGPWAAEGQVDPVDLQVSTVDVDGADVVDRLDHHARPRVAVPVENFEADQVGLRRNPGQCGALRQRAQRPLRQVLCGRFVVYGETLFSVREAGLTNGSVVNGGTGNSINLVRKATALSTGTLIAPTVVECQYAGSVP